MSMEEERLVDPAVQNLLANGAKEICSPNPSQFITNIFHHPKEGWGDGGGGREKASSRDMRELKQFAEYLPFKIEDILQLKDILQRGDYMTKLDLPTLT